MKIIETATTRRFTAEISQAEMQSLESARATLRRFLSETEDQSLWNALNAVIVLVNKVVGNNQ